MATSKTFIESRFEMEKILKEERLGFLGMSLNNIPYTIPLTYGYNDGKIIFHCSLTGKKLKYIKSNPQVCFTVGCQFGEFIPHPQGAVCHAHSDSVICYGVARIIEDIEERCKILNIFNRCLQTEAREIIIDEVSNCKAVEIKVTEMTGREERDSKCTYWKYNFTEK
jgi:nitroimidazol reductase NimA-like FMN-containing flavoprotein (pyridoxamine 5'-phosphate oxidase superfamily)